MSPNTWKTNSRYNALHLSKKLVPIIRALETAALLDVAKGSYSGPGAKGNRTTRIRASDELQTLFRDAKFVRDDVTRFQGEEIIILRDAKEANKIGKQVEYTDTDETTAMRKELKAYNDLLASSFIDIATLQEPVIQVDPKVQASHINIHADNTRSRRVFSRSNWEMNGRFYGGWWQRVNDDWRSKIFIDDQPTVEVDFKGLHIAMLYAEAGQEIQGDPYTMQGISYGGVPSELLRKTIKKLVLTAINAKGKSSAYKAFREGIPKGYFGKSLNNEKLDEYLGIFLAQNPLLTDLMFTDQGIRLMYLDSQITALVHRHFTNLGIPVLSVHDSYIINHSRIAELRQVMTEASEAVMGIPLSSAIKLPDMTEYSDVSDKQIYEHVENRRGLRCQGYMDRMFDYQDKTGRRISPVSGNDESSFYGGK